MFQNVSKCIEMYQDVLKYVLKCIKMYQNVLKCINCIEMYQYLLKCIKMFCCVNVARFARNVQ